MDDSDVDDESVAPEPVGDAVNAQNLPSAAGGGAGPPPPAAAQHPVWAAAAGRGRSAAKNKPDSVFGPISMIELEIRGRNDLDGASSTASDHGGGGRRGKDASKQPAKKRRAGAATKRPREYDDDDDDDDNEGGRGGDSGEDGDADGAESTASADMAGAAFGGGAATKKRACVPCGSEMSDDGASVTSSVVRARHERAFPVTGVTCVGCALPAKIQPVIDFIAKNMSTMSELALYKMAALVYKTKVAEPAEEEGVDVPPWGAPFCPFALSPFRPSARTLARFLRADWKEIRAHFQLHAVDSRMQRYENIRTLSAMRKTLEMQLLRRDQETGEQSLDKNNAESIMKIIAASSRELTLLADPGSTKKRG
jgi:hypothetical protein